MIDRTRLVSALAFVAGFVVAAALAFHDVRPLSASPVGYDTAGTVLYFQRMVHGIVLEQPYGVTPKPLMTVIDGVLYEIGGWRAVSLAAVFAFAATVSMGSAMAWRLAGPAAAGFAFVSLLGSAPLILDTSLAYATPWAALFLLIAGFGVLARPRRYLLIGIALGAATLCRLEAIVTVGGAIGAVVAWWVLARRRLTEPPPRAAWLVALGALAVPIMLVHDWVLIRDPMYWASVSARYAANYPDSVRSPLELATWLGTHYAGMALLTALAVTGEVALVLRRRLAVAAGLALLAPGICVLLLGLAVRDTYISARYVYLADLAVTIAAAVGVALVRLPELESMASARARWPRRLNPAIAISGAALIAVAATVPFALRDRTTRESVRTQVVVGENLAAAEPRIRTALAGRPAGTGQPELLAPGLWTPRLIVDLGLRIADVSVVRYDAADDAIRAGSLADGQLVYHDRAGDAAAAGAWTAVEAGGQVTLGPVTLVPVASDPAAGWWLLRVVARS